MKVAHKIHFSNLFYKIIMHKNLLNKFLYTSKFEKKGIKEVSLNPEILFINFIIYIWKYAILFRNIF